MRLRSSAKRPVHLGPFPLERLRRVAAPKADRVPTHVPLPAPDGGAGSIAAAMVDYLAVMDTLRDGAVNPAQATCPDDPAERARHIKSFAYFSDVDMAGICRLEAGDHLAQPVTNPEVARLSHALQTRQTTTLAAGIDQIMADLRDAAAAPPSQIDEHTHALVLIHEHPRAVDPSEPGAAAIAGAEAYRAALRGGEVAVVLANYLRVLGFAAKAHTPTGTDVDLNRLAVAAGLATVEDGTLTAPFIGDRFGISVVTTDFDMTPDQPLAPLADQPRTELSGLGWWLGHGQARTGMNGHPYESRQFALGPHPFETLKRVETPTTYIDAPNVPRVPKRADLFARAQFGDMGKHVQKQATGGTYVRKAAPSMAQRRLLGALVLLQAGPGSAEVSRLSPREHSEMIKAAAYWLGADAVGLSACPDWTWYSHNALGEVIEPPHDQAISMVIDQGFDTMEGASGDDWISVAQSMRAYLRFSVLGGVLAQFIRNLGYSAKAHTVMDGDVLQPPLLLLSGLGEVSRIGEVILNPFLGPRLKSGVITTDMPLEHDQPIDFGLQAFCESCNKCARECPSGAITAGPKRMFNGYEIWKSDSQKCATYRMTTEGGAMCGRCMKTCPWNLEGLFAEKPFRWAAMTLPKAAPLLSRLDDAVGNGDINPVKKWWWDLALGPDGGYHPTDVPVNTRGLQRDLKIKAEDQTLAVYPAPLAAHPHPFPDPMDREAGIAAYQEMVSAEDYKAGKGPRHVYTNDTTSPVLRVEVTGAEPLSEDITLYTLQRPDRAPLPGWTAGAHIDVVVAPEYLRQYSLCGDPAVRDRYQLAVLREDKGRGGSHLMHRIFTPGRRVFIAPPRNHFPIAEGTRSALLYGGGIGITPMIAMAHTLHRDDVPFQMHYSVPRRARAALWELIAGTPWADRAHLHVSDEGGRLDLAASLTGAGDGTHVYCCGPDGYMEAVGSAARGAGLPEDAIHTEYFAVPEAPDWENSPFRVTLARSGRTVDVDADTPLSDALIAAGVPVDVKCADGLCGVCQCGVIEGNVEHRDYVLSRAERETRMITCQSRAAEAGGTLILDL